MLQSFTTPVATFIYYFFFNDTPTTEIYTLSLHDALPISLHADADACGAGNRLPQGRQARPGRDPARGYAEGRDRKSTRLNSSHMSISYAVFCLKKKKTIHKTYTKSQYTTNSFNQQATLH